MTLLARHRQPQQNLRTQKAAIEVRQRVIGDTFDQYLGVQHLILAIRTKGDIRDQMRGKGGDAYRPDLWIAGDLAAGIDLRAEVGAVVGAVRRPEGGAIHGPQGESLPCVTLGVLVAPGACGPVKQLRQGRGPEPLSGLGHRTLTHRMVRGRRLRQIQCGQDLGHRLVPVERQRDDQPHHLLGRSSPPPDAGRAGGCERLLNPRQR